MNGSRRIRTWFINIPNRMRDQGLFIYCSLAIVQMLRNRSLCPLSAAYIIRYFSFWIVPRSCVVFKNRNRIFCGNYRFASRQCFLLCCAFDGLMERNGTDNPLETGKTTSVRQGVDKLMESSPKKRRRGSVWKWIQLISNTNPRREIIFTNLDGGSCGWLRFFPPLVCRDEGRFIFHFPFFFFLFFFFLPL